MPKLKQFINDLQNIVYSYVGYKELYDRVINEINTLLTKKNALFSRKKYEMILGTSGYMIYHRTYADHIRVISIQRQYEGLNSILFDAHHFLLTFKLNTRKTYYDSDDFTAGQIVGNYIEESIYQYEEDFEDED